MVLAEQPTYRPASIIPQPTEMSAQTSRRLISSKARGRPILAIACVLPLERKENLTPRRLSTEYSVLDRQLARFSVLEANRMFRTIEPSGLVGPISTEKLGRVAKRVVRPSSVGCRRHKKLLEEINPMRKVAIFWKLLVAGATQPFGLGHPATRSSVELREGRVRFSEIRRKCVRMPACPNDVFTPIWLMLIS